MKFLMDSCMLPRLWHTLTICDTPVATLKLLQRAVFDFVANNRCRQKPWFRLSMNEAQHALSEGCLGVCDVFAAVSSRRMSALAAASRADASCVKIARELQEVTPDALRSWMLLHLRPQDSELAEAALQGNRPRRQMAVKKLYCSLANAYTAPAFVPQMRSGADPLSKPFWARVLKLPISNHTKQSWWYTMAHCLPSGSHLRHWPALSEQDKCCVMCTSGVLETDRHWMYTCEPAHDVWLTINRILFGMRLPNISRDAYMHGYGVESTFPDWAVDFITIAICEVHHALYRYRMAIKRGNAQRDPAVLRQLLTKSWTLDLSVALRHQRQHGKDSLRRTCQQLQYVRPGSDLLNSIVNALRSAADSDSRQSHTSPMDPPPAGSGRLS